MSDIAKKILSATNKFRASAGLPNGYKVEPNKDKSLPHSLIDPEGGEIARFYSLEDFGAFLRAVTEAYDEEA